MRDIENTTFTPLVFTSVDRMAGEATVFYRRLASLLASKRDEPYSVVMPDGFDVYFRSSFADLPLCVCEEQGNVVSMRATQTVHWKW